MKKILASLLLALFAGMAFAQPYPAKPIRIIVAYPPGGGTDVLARLVGKFLNDSIKQSVVIENRAGANGGTPPVRCRMRRRHWTRRRATCGWSSVKTARATTCRR